VVWKRQLGKYVNILLRMGTMSKLNVPHDIWLGLMAEIYMNVYYEPSKLVKYRRHDKNLSSSGDISSKSLYYKLSYRFILIIALVKKYISNCMIGSVYMKVKKV